MPSNSEVKKTTIECDCGTHMLKIESHVDYYDDTVSNKTRFHQEFNLAMFNYGNQKRNFFSRFGIAFKYLVSGNMYADQLCLNPEEAKKMITFLNDNLIEPDPE